MGRAASCRRPRRFCGARSFRRGAARAARKRRRRRGRGARRRLAESVLCFDELITAGEIARRARRDPAAEIEKTGQFVAEALARLDAQEGRRDAADPAPRAAAKAAVPLPSGDDSGCCGQAQRSRPQPEAPSGSSRPGGGLRPARSAGRLVEALELELEMADVDFAHGRAADGAASVEAVARQAKQLGLVELSARARLPSVPTRPREAGGRADEPGECPGLLSFRGPAAQDGRVESRQSSGRVAGKSSRSRRNSAVCGSSPEVMVVGRGLLCTHS